MIQFNERRLESDLGFRFEYLSEFMDLGVDGIVTNHASAAALAPLVPALVDADFSMLHRYDAT